MFIALIALDSDGYTTGDIDYFWGKTREHLPIEAVAFNAFSLPQFIVKGYNVNTTESSTSSGMYSMFANLVRGRVHPGGREGGRLPNTVLRIGILAQNSKTGEDPCLFFGRLQRRGGVRRDRPRGACM
jgi:hypothetical protein